MKKLQVILVMLLLTSCSSTRPQTKYFGHFSSTNDIITKIGQAQKLHDRGDIESSITLLKSLIEETSYNPMLDQAYFLLINSLLELAKIAEAKFYAVYFKQNYPSSPSLRPILDLFNNKAVYPE